LGRGRFDPKESSGDPKKEGLTENKEREKGGPDYQATRKRKKKA